MRREGSKFLIHFLLAYVTIPMTTPYETGTRVEWDWGRGTAQGFITETFTQPVARTLKGAHVKRNATDDNPAYLIRHDSGSDVLKSHSELREA
ncbi:DUF2945 domain-containing protein [Hyphomonas oceanitis]|uniref:Hypervirulence associated protein TUDOR domain-containing protein n=1 Tax=Hyphomonas oceanitis SCH89 TaxID=1280953 RepID=A0A059GAY3_9PROT|nr:DUF2945 domain-containing protein [Hyphomonas oceanitis]KDA03648.1 hypothetical protein HOC_04177 [Hyphomonas oceanitis SCH89]